MKRTPLGIDVNHNKTLLAGMLLSLLVGCSSDGSGLDGVDGGGGNADGGGSDPADLSYPIVDTKQTACYDAQTQITCPSAGAAFDGQDAQFAGNQPSYTVSADGLTVYDNVTRLTWQRSPDTNQDGVIDADDKLTYDEAEAWPATVNASNYGGFSDWRLPTIKEQYSLIQFDGTDPSGLTGTDTSSLTPFIDDTIFHFAYGDTSAGERIIDSQYASSNAYVATISEDLLFGVNFADGRIKGYGLTMPGGGAGKTFLVTLVRGNPDYGINDFVDNGDGTVTDRATGLMWMQDDSGEGMNWEEALAYAAAKNDASFLGYDDWRLPNVKELQSIVDYSRSPDTTSSAAIDPIFQATQITNEAYTDDYAWYWTGTTHAAYSGSGASGSYVCFGRALGYMTSGWRDIHGAGAQRSDPKGSLSGATARDNGYYNAIAPQGDAVRMNNFVRLVRDGATATTPEPPATPVDCAEAGDGEPCCGDDECLAPETESNCPADCGGSSEGPVACEEETDCDAVDACPPEAALGCSCMPFPSGGNVCIPNCVEDQDCPQPPDMTLICSADQVCVPS